MANPHTLTVLAAPLLAACLGCSPTSPSPVSAPPEALTLRTQTAHFAIYAGTAADSLVQDVANRLEGEYGRVLADLRLSDVPRVTVRIWSDSPTYYQAMEQYFGTRYSGASGYVAGPAEIRLLSNPQLASNAVHEFCHIASLRVNATIANNPRWLWETVAVYENGEFVQPTSLGYLQSGAYPSLSEMNAGINASRQVYELGYLLGEFIVTTWGQDALVRLIQANGDLRTVVGLDEAAFMERWYAFVRRKYFQQRSQSSRSTPPARPRNELPRTHEGGRNRRVNTDPRPAACQRDSGYFPGGAPEGGDGSRRAGASLATRPLSSMRSTFVEILDT